jgi:hypothetical protein
MKLIAAAVGWYQHEGRMHQRNRYLYEIIDIAGPNAFMTDKHPCHTNATSPDSSVQDLPGSVLPCLERKQTRLSPTKCTKCTSAAEIC